MDRKSTCNLMTLLNLTASMEMGEANELRRFVHVLRSEEDSLLKLALDFEVRKKKEKAP